MLRVHLRVASILLFLAVTARVRAAPTELDLATTDGDWVAWGTSASEGGTAIVAGDLNGDGTPDLAISEPRWDDPVIGMDLGRVSVFLGPLVLPGGVDLSSSVPSFRIEGTAAGFKLGTRLFVADLTEDGLVDLLVASADDGVGGGRLSAGSVSVFFGRAVWPARLSPADADFVFLGAEALDSPWEAAVGDLNGDGSPDLALAAVGLDGPGNTRNDSGEAYVFFGPCSSWTKRVYDLAVDPPGLHILGADGTGDHPVGTNGDMFGWALRIADLIGDATPDLIVAALGGAGPGNTQGNTGEVYAFRGRPSWPAVIDTRFVSPDLLVYNTRNPTACYACEPRCGPYATAVAVADWDADGLPDLFIGSEQYTNSASCALVTGAISILRGGPGLVGVRDLEVVPPEETIVGPRTASRIGTEVEVADVNGDGFLDAISGAWSSNTPYARQVGGEVLVVTGCGSFQTVRDLAVEPAEIMVVGGGHRDHWGRRLVVADIDQDGFADLLAGADGSASLGDARGPAAGEAHIVRGFATPSVCAVTADAGPPISVCGESDVRLDAARTVVAGCSGTPEYRWLAPPAVIRDWASDPTVTVHAAATTAYRVEVRCGDCRGPCYGEATVTVLVDPDGRPEDLGNTIRAVRLASGIDMSWSGTLLARTYRLYRGTTKGVWPGLPLLTDLPVTSARLPDLGPPPLYFYRASGVSCGDQEGP